MQYHWHDEIVSEFVELGYSDLSTGQILIKDKGAQNIIYGSYIKILGYPIPTLCILYGRRRYGRSSNLAQCLHWMASGTYCPGS